MKITLRNNYHNTSVNLIPEEYAGDAIGKLSKSQCARARRVLCGVSGCACGDDLGCRGPQDYVIEPYIDIDGKIAGALVYDKP